MLENRKDQNNNQDENRINLYFNIYETANKLKDSINIWDAQKYILGIFLYRCLSEQITTYITLDQIANGREGFDYALGSDIRALYIAGQMSMELGYFIKPSELFENVVKLIPNNGGLSRRLSTTLKNIERSTMGCPTEPKLQKLSTTLDFHSPVLGATEEARDALLQKMLLVVEELYRVDYGTSTIDMFCGVFADICTYKEQYDKDHPEAK